MAAWRYEISLLMLKKYFTRSLRSLRKYFSTLQKKLRISAWPCNILYIFMGSVYSKMATNFMIYFFMVIGPQCLVSE